MSPTGRRGGPPWTRADGRPGWSGRSRGRAGRGGPPWGPPRRAFGCLFGIFLLVGGAAFVVVGSVVLSVAGLLGGGEAPGISQLAAIVVIAIGIVGFVAVGRWLRGTASTLDDLVAAAGRVEAGDYAVRVDPPQAGPRPLRSLVHGFNTMTGRLAADERQRRSLLADVSHELRTPLAVIQGSLEAIADGVHPPDEAHVEAILDETRVLGRLVDDLRTVALAETGSLPLHPEPTDLSVLAADVVGSFAVTARRGGLTLTADVAEEIPLLDLDPVRIREVLSNLVANAIRATPAGGSVRVRAATATGRSPGPTPLAGPPATESVRVEVVDTGSGMTDDELAHAFDRFWKSPESRGSGLGLAIARNLVLAHGGDIGAMSRPGSGTTVWFSLPLDRG